MTNQKSKTAIDGLTCFSESSARQFRRFFRLLFLMAWTVEAVIASTLKPSSPPQKGDFFLADGKSAAVLYCDSLQEKAVDRAVRDLAGDIQSVTGVKPPVVRRVSNATARAVIIGQLGRGGLVDSIAAAGKIDAEEIRRQWESWVTGVVEHPAKGIDRALVIAGSDRRGTVYGIYELSESVGVSPWVWWADVPPRRARQIAFSAGLRHRHGPPGVKYRGLFLNDEDWGLFPWSAQTLDPRTGNIGPGTYEKIFELILRLRGNALWPAMHPGTRAFNFYPENRELADRFGIVMGSSHCEQMLRNNVDEWKRDGAGEYNYETNREGVLCYWEDRVRQNARYESVYTMGMRGIHDSGMPGGGTPGEQADRLERVISDQRSLLAKWVDPDVCRVPQIFCPYKEVLDLYRRAGDIPGDITLVWPDDNFGYVRQFSNEAEQKRSGGAGVYYHISYWGRPYDYLWLHSTHPALVREEMKKAWDTGARTFWIFNAGDIKPAEIGIECALRLAWNPQSGEDGMAAILSKDVLPLLKETYRLHFQRKPEHMGFDANHPFLSKPAFSVSANGDEAQKRLGAFRSLVSSLESIEKKLKPEQRDAFFEMIGYPVRAAALMNEKGIFLARYFAYAGQGRACAPGMLDRARSAEKAIHELTAAYNDKTADGKWKHMMSDHPRDLPVFSMPETTFPAVPDADGWGIAVEGNGTAVTASENGIEAPGLPQFHVLSKKRYFVDVFGTGKRQFQWKARTDAGWIRLDRSSGKGDARIWAEADWSRMPGGETAQACIRFSGGGKSITVPVNAARPAQCASMRPGDFYEDNRRVVMEAEHASERTAGVDASWIDADGLGYNGMSVTLSSNTMPVRIRPDAVLRDSPRLEYPMWIDSPGAWTVTVRMLPTWSVEADSAQRYAIALDDGSPVVVSRPAYTGERDSRWQEDVLRNAALVSTAHVIGSAGRHTLRIWPVDPGIVIDRIIADGGCPLEPGYIGPDETRFAGGSEMSRR
jgi:hypothetical protein